MKKQRISSWMFQALIFNIIVIIIFIVIILNFILPEYFKIEKQKEVLDNLQIQNNQLKKSWLDYNDFRKLFLKDNTKSEYLKNIYSDPEKDFKWIYELNFINKKNIPYSDFISKKQEEIKNQEEQLNKSKLKEKIANILPFYKNSASLSGNWITDFKFVNYMEDLLHRFNLEYEGNLWIWELKLVNSQKSKKIKKQKSQLDWEIYSFDLGLQITWSKKNIIDFIHYIENVWVIHFSKDWNDIILNKLNNEKFFEDKKWNLIVNNFVNLKWDYFYDKDNVYNNIDTTIKSIKLDKYIDSSLDPIAYDNNQTFIWFLKQTQAKEKYKIDIVLTFYVKWLEKYKTIKYINKVVLSYSNLKKIINVALVYWRKNKAKLKNNALYSLRKLEKYNSYLLSIQKDIKNLSNKKKINEDIWNIYKQAQQYNNIIKHMKLDIITNLKNISEKLYNQYKKIENDK